MIIEIKDLPNGQSIDKIDIHIDFQKGIQTVSTQPQQPVQTVLLEEKEEKEVPQEMLDGEF